jgi:hypothetical protein
MAWSFVTATPEQRATIIANMRADWLHHRDRLLAEGSTWWAENYFQQTKRSKPSSIDLGEK